MELKPKATVCAVLMLLLLLSSYDGGAAPLAAEARVCTGKSQHHSFPCLSDRICSGQCAKQGGGWTAGYCHFRVCTCQKRC